MHSTRTSWPLPIPSSIYGPAPGQHWHKEPPHLLSSLSSHSINGKSQSSNKADMGFVQVSIFSTHYMTSPSTPANALFHSVARGWVLTKPARHYPRQIRQNPRDPQKCVPPHSSRHIERQECSFEMRSARARCLKPELITWRSPRGHPCRCERERTGDAAVSPLSQPCG
jgi:hypothetical protein